VPRAVAAQGHRVIALTAEDPADDAAAGDPHRPHRLRLRKA
jgi:hypothetical protein